MTNSTIFVNAKPGLRVWGYLHGWGTIAEVNLGNPYPIVVDFDSNIQKTFTIDGLGYRTDINPTLFWGEISFEPPVQPPSMKIVNGVEIPDISFAPDHLQNFFYPNITKQDLFSCATPSELQGYVPHKGIQNRMIAAGMCYPYTKEGKEAAILHAKAILGIKVTQ